MSEKKLRKKLRVRKTFRRLHAERNTKQMKFTQKNDRLTQVKEGRKVIFEILQTRNGLFTGFEYRGLALASDCETIEQCVNPVSYTHLTLPTNREV